MNDLPDFDTAVTNGSEPPKRQRGRPPGSKNKARKATKKVAVARGRPPGRPPANPFTPEVGVRGYTPQTIASAVNTIMGWPSDMRKTVLAIVGGLK